MAIQCSSCGADMTEILVRHLYSIVWDGEQGKWKKEEGDATYFCGNCLQELDTHDIEDALRQTDEL